MIQYSFSLILHMNLAPASFPRSLAVQCAINCVALSQNMTTDEMLDVNNVCRTLGCQTPLFRNSMSHQLGWRWLPLATLPSTRPTSRRVRAFRLSANGTSHPPCAPLILKTTSLYILIKSIAHALVVIALYQHASLRRWHAMSRPTAVPTL